jgi:arsenite methyltransferase
MKTITKTASQVDKLELEQKVKKMYSGVALHPEATYHFEMGKALALELGYPIHELDKVPAAAIDSFAGVGYYFDLAQLRKGERVVDLGSGSGMDSFFAALQVGDTGEVIGVDMTNEQLNKANQLKDRFGFKQVSFLKGYIENVPVSSGIADAVISNGVINLSGDKQKVFGEAARILKQGGRFVIADIVTTVSLPHSISCNATLWAACIGGAMQKDEYYRHIEDAGFKVMQVKTNPYEFISNSAKGATKDYGILSISLLAIKR